MNVVVVAIVVLVATTTMIFVIVLELIKRGLLLAILETDLTTFVTVRHMHATTTDSD